MDANHKLKTMYKLYLTLFITSLGLVLQSQTIVNPFDSHRNAFNQRDIISVFNQPNESVQQQVLVYDWIEAFEQNAWSNIEQRSNGLQTAADASNGYIVIETANFNGDGKDDVFYLNEYQNKWTYGAVDQTETLNEEDSLYDYTLTIPTFVDGPGLNGNHSFPCVSVGDFNGDSIDEVAVASVQGDDDTVLIQIISVSDND